MFSEGYFQEYDEVIESPCASFFRCFVTNKYDEPTSMVTLSYPLSQVLCAFCVAKMDIKEGAHLFVPTEENLRFIPGLLLCGGGQLEVVLFAFTSCRPKRVLLDTRVRIENLERRPFSDPMK